VAAVVCLGSVFQGAQTEFAMPWVLATAVSGMLVALGPATWARSLVAPGPLALGRPWLWCGLVPGWSLMIGAGILKLMAMPPRVVGGVWLLGLAWLLGAAVDATRRRSGLRPTISIVGGAILLVALVLRFAWLDEIPRGVHCDEGTVNLMARRIYEDPRIDWFAPPVTGAYAIMSFFYALAGVGQLWLGFNLVGARFSAALLGSLSVWLVYDGARRLVSRRLAAVAALLVAVNHCHFAFSRIASGYIQTAFVVALMFSLASRLWTAPTPLNTVALGIVMALGMQTYPASLTAAPILVVVLAVSWLLDGSNRGRRHLPLGLAGLTFLAAGAPFWVMLATRGNDLLARSREVNIFLAPHIMANLKANVYRTDSTLAVVAQQAGNALLGFHLNLNAEPQYGPETGMTDPFTAMLLVPGLLCLLRRWRHPLAIFAVAFTAGYLLLGLGLQYAPGYNRTTGALPLGMLIAAVGLVACVETVLGTGARWRHAAVVLSLAAAVWIAAMGNLSIYSRSWGGVISGDADSESGWIAREFGADYHIHLVDWAEPGPEGLQLITAGLPVSYNPSHDSLMYVREVEPSGADLFLFHQVQSGAIAELQRRFPEALVETRRRDPVHGPTMWLVFVGGPRVPHGSRMGGN